MRHAARRKTRTCPTIGVSLTRHLGLAQEARRGFDNGWMSYTKNYRLSRLCFLLRGVLLRGGEGRARPQCLTDMRRGRLTRTCPTIGIVFDTAFGLAREACRAFDNGRMSYTK